MTHSRTCLLLVLSTLLPLMARPAPAIPPRSPAGLLAASIAVPRIPLRFHPLVAESARLFLEQFIAYTEVVEEGVQDLLPDGSGGAGFAELSRVSKQVRGRHRDRYLTAMGLALNHHRNYTEQLAPLVKRDATYIHVYKSLFIALLVDRSTGTALAAFPIALGARSNLGPKTAKGDLRSPEATSDQDTWETTPFFAHPLLAEDPYIEHGCITRGIGVSSTDSLYPYLSTGWTVMFHGTPDRRCIGTRASHGCIRLLAEHIIVLFRHVRTGTRIVMAP